MEFDPGRTLTVLKKMPLYTLKPRRCEILDSDRLMNDKCYTVVDFPAVPAVTKSQVSINVLVLMFL